MYAASITRTKLALTTALLFTASAASAADVKLPDGDVVKKVDFERHLMGVFGRMGCNAGSCHGSFQGKGGFRLSLFGYDPEKDFLAITRDANGRRINRQDPDSSLLLLKATGQLEHGGKVRFDKQSWAYQLLREWIAQGAEWEKGSGAVKSIQITPAEIAFAKPGENGALTVRATFADGSTENITPVCDFRTNDETVVEVNALGEVKAVRPGDTAVIVSYRGNVLPVRVLVPTEAGPDFKYPDVPQVNYIDREVFAKLKRLNVVPSDLSTDAEFLRRVTLDTIGSLPTAKEVLDFQSDPRPDKRARKIDELLAHPLHAALWATKFSDITGNNTAALENPQQFQPRLSQMWHDWLRKRVAENQPYDEIVRGILCATSRENLSPEEYVKQFSQEEEEAQKGVTTTYQDRATLDLFWRRQQPVTVDQWGEKTAAAFLGVRLECAQCHKHPFDRWTQNDYRSYSNIFAAVTFGTSADSKKAFDEANAERKKNAAGKNQNQILTLREIFIGPGGKGTNPLPDPETKKPLTPKALGGPEITVKAGDDPRVALFEWMRREDNPFFARSFVNRVWGHYFGVGIVNPVDDFSLANPASNDKLLDALAKDFIESKYDIRRLERTVLNSRTYQLSHLTNASNRLDRKNYSHSYVRPLMAEVVVDVLSDAVGVKESFGADAPPDCRALEVGSSRVQNGTVAYALRVFGRPPRTTACDCERAMEPGLPQKLFLMADPTLNKQKLEAPNNHVKTLLKNEPDDDKALDELFLATLARLPTANERERFADYRKSAKNREAAFNDALWAIINTTEFIFNH
jgi:Protein of unknown function (DUF1549)/Protein of unknown function (DUF1553)